MTEDLYVLPASYGQQRLWLLEQIDPDTPLYNEAVGLRLRGPLDTAALAAAMSEVVARHEVLRSVLELEGAEVVQVVREAEPLALPLHEADSHDMALTEARELAAVPFDLGRGPLVRCRLTRTGPDDHLFTVVVHHAVADGWSLGVLLAELTQLYEAAVRGEDLSAVLPELAVQYADFAAWQKERLDTGELDGQLDHWRARLADVAQPALPTDHVPAGAPGRGTVQAPLRLPAAMVRQLRAVAGDTGDVTPFMVALAAYAVVLARWTRSPDVVVGLPFVGRSQEELESLVGFFVNTVPVRVDLSADPEFTALLGQVRGRCVDAYGNADVPFELLVETLKLPRRSGRTPLTQTMLAVNNTWLPDGAEAAGVAIEPTTLLQERAHFEITVDLDGDGDELTGAVVLQADLFTQETADLLARSVTAVLRGAAMAPGTRISALPCPLAEERAAAPADETRDVRRDETEPATQQARQAGPAQAPRSATEIMLARLWTEVLERDTVGVHEEFYAAGGNSLRAVRVVMRAREQGVELPMERVLGEHTIRELADLL